MNASSASVIDTLRNHVSIREYLDKPLDDKTIHFMINAARRSPTSSNMQAYSFVVVKNQEKKVELARLTGNQHHVETCSAFIAICADISRLRQACDLHEASLAQNLENTLVATVDASLVGMSLSLVAESMQLGTVMIGGIRNHPKEVSQLLGLPKGVFVVYGLCIGWPDWQNVKNQKPRLPEKAIIHHEQYYPIEDQVLQGYDSELFDHYEAQGRNAHKDAWTGIIATRFSTPRRPHLRSDLEELGFQFD